MTKPFLTIGIASYNYSKYLDKALEQIKKQNFKDIEVLYCDDGSIDGSVEQIKQYIEREKEISIRIIEGNHDGLLANRNRIVDNAYGEYLMICDADDYMMDNCLELLCSAAKKYDADCVIGGFCEVSDNGDVIKTHIPTSNASKWLYTWHHGQIYRTDLIRNNNIRFEEIPDDVFYLQKLHSVCKNTVFVHQNIYAWCRHGNSTSADYDKNPEWHPVKLWNNISKFIAELIEEQKDVDVVNLDYYLYKWFYFNILDLWQEDFKQIRIDLRSMQDCMKCVKPDYRKIKSLTKIMTSGDTLFARVAVMACWVLDKLHIIYVGVFIRKLQHRMRK